MRQNNTQTLITNSPEETMDVGKELAKNLVPGTMVYLYGELGSGKTVLVKGICQGLGVQEPVTSPSFVIATEYRGSVPVAHIDLYRLDHTTVTDLPIDDYIKADGVTVVEWADRIEHSGTGIKIRVRILGETRRELTIEDFRH